MGNTNANFLQHEPHFHIIAEKIKEAIIIVNEHREHLYISPALYTTFGYDVEQVKRARGFSNIYEEDAVVFSKWFEATMASGQSSQVEVRCLHAQKGWVWTQFHGTPVYDDNQQFLHIVFVVRDISVEKELEEQLSLYAYVDRLSALPNRTALTQDLDVLLARKEDEREPYAVLMLNIDDFKRVNEKFGYTFGDDVIRYVGDVLQSFVTADVKAYRLAGDEFVIKVAKANAPTVRDLLQRITEKLEQPVTLGDITLTIPASMGGIISQHYDYTVTQLLLEVDEMVHKVKLSSTHEYQIEMI
ncbi:GGDEF domain-containing protein [Caryophanon latum]|uniref:Diguanylate cyclase n=1 Tax=Caryophanon latum TaxID=33977 RepID=A0A1C0YUD5_9BACL|nr:diguanylate cyclase [Caryophanon latum]OCS90734.1 hypothetical protein A6K76_01395 [Caryophanon latum]